MLVSFLEMMFVFGGLAAAVLLLRAIFRSDRPCCLSDDLGTEVPCPRCHHVNPTHARYCAHCGRRLA